MSSAPINSSAVSGCGHRHRLELRPRRRPRTGSSRASAAADRIARAASAGPRRRRAAEPQRRVDGPNHGGDPGLSRHCGRRRGEADRRRRDRGDAGRQKRRAVHGSNPPGAADPRRDHRWTGRSPLRICWCRPGPSGVERPPVRPGWRQHAGLALQAAAAGSRHQPAFGRAPPEREVSDVRSAAGPRRSAACASTS